MPTYEVDATLTSKARLWVQANNAQQARAMVEAATSRQLRRWSTSRNLLRNVDASVVSLTREQTDFVR